ncbi:MAG TPA: AMP-binding protein [Burkholderiales bacterium]
MADKVWLKSYPPGIPAEIDYHQFTSVKHLFESCCEQYGAKTAYSNLDYRMSYTELAQRARQFAAYLQSLPGVTRGDRVAVMMPNLLQYPVAIFGVLCAGLVVVNVNPLYTPRELEHQLKDSGAKVIVIVENFCHTLEQALHETPVKHVITTQIGDLIPAPKRWVVNFVVKNVKKMVKPWNIPGTVGMRAALARGAAAAYKSPDLTHDDIAFLQYTGGTTGVAKGAMLTHRNMLANLEQSGAWISGEFRKGEEVVVSPLPMYHVFCLTATLLFMKWGANNVLITNPRDMKGFIAELAKWRWTVLTGVNTLFNGMLNTEGFDALDFSHVKVVLGGGAAVQKAVAEKWQKVTGHSLTEAYGLTETSPGVCINPMGMPWKGSIGLPLPSTDVSIRSDDLRDLGIWDGQGDSAPYTGEICVRGPQVMKGYWQRDDETAKIIKEGWLLTGDVGHMDGEGFVFITDRKKDMILVSGFNVYPNEIEGVVQMHPGVLECAAVGVPDEKSGETVKIVIVRKDPNLTKEDILAFCRENLTGYKMPRIVEFRNDLPKTPVGKILRRELRDQPKA